LGCADRILDGMLAKWGTVFEEINADTQVLPYQTTNYFDELPNEFSREFLAEFLKRKGLRTPINMVIYRWKRKGWIICNGKSMIRKNN